MEAFAHSQALTHLYAHVRVDFREFVVKIVLVIVLLMRHIVKTGQRALKINLVQ
jgi:hypothetical protein